MGENMRKVKLGDIIGKAISGEWGADDNNGTGIPVLRTTNFTNDGVINYNNVVTRDLGTKDLTKKYLNYGDIIIEKSGGSDNQPVGRVVYFEGQNKKYLFNNFTAVLRVKDTSKWLPKYVFYYLFNNYIIGGTLKFQNKTTGLRNLQLEGYINSICVQDISINEQIHIVALVDLVSGLISKRKSQLEKLDELIKSKFTEMFGDIKQNNKCWNELYGRELFKFSSGKFLDESKRLKQGVPVYGGNGIAWYTTDALVNEPTIIIGRVGVYCGNINFITKPVWITDNAIYIKSLFKNCFNLVFLYELMVMMNFSQFADYSGQPKITQKPLENSKYIIPPFELQNQFADFVEKVEGIKIKVKQSLAQLEVLKKSLMQKYFG